MKTLVVLSALVALALAAPSTPGEGLKDRTPDWHNQAQSGLTDVIRREKKSPVDTTTTLHHEATNIEDIDTSVPVQAARSMALKKPLIVRRKYGHHTLFRDSEEEKALTDSHETCSRQVKVKLCGEDRDFGSSRSHASHDSDIHVSEDDMKHSIRMAKEAVETLQRDLKKMDHHATMKLRAHESESDNELHEDIEKARKALEHIHQNFGNLETMNLHATASRDSDTMQNVHITIAKTDEERMAQWKEAMVNIQKNVEIARNIEDSFKAANQQDSMVMEQSALETDKKEHTLNENIDSQLLSHGDSQMRVIEQTPLNQEEEKITEDKTLNEEVNQHLNTQNARQQENIEDDMNMAPSTNIEMHGTEVKNQELFRSEGHEVHEHSKTAEEKMKHIQSHQNTMNLEHETAHSYEHEHHHHHHHHHQQKSSEMNQHITMDQTEHHTSQLPVIKVTEESVDTELARENVPESDMIVHTITSNIKPTSDSLKEHPRTVEQVDVNAEQHLKHEKSAEDTNDMIDFLAKSAEQLKDEAKETENVLTETQNISEIGKAAEIPTINHEQIVEPKENVETEEKIIDTIPKSSEHVELVDLQETATHNENTMLAKAVDHAFVQNKHKEHMIDHMIENVDVPHLTTLTAPKHAEENHHHHHHHLHQLHQEIALDHVSPKNVEEPIITPEDNIEDDMIHEHELDHMRHSYIPEHAHQPNRIGFAHDYELSSHGQHQMHPYPMRHHHSMMTHPNMHEMGNFGGMHSNYHGGMRDAMESLASEHNFRWQPTHESARGAYGGGLSGPIGPIGAGAVGVFPTANTGGCGIPLLLSCSPSVVSGSLAKPHSIGGSFGPSFRNEEDFGFHNKRDIKKTNEHRTTNTLRNTAIIKQKSPIVMDNKQ
ncbi:unnamed protein product [Chrysodeixis includens]|uniref:Uncharacterized protein n=1 Tax=Chrysodeixis includens TaxID=689277 RepID=A0A9P0C1E7_CHRIL|nr:unnamed protein product [Chrysodeixis includens]